MTTTEFLNFYLTSLSEWPFLFSTNNHGDTGSLQSVLCLNVSLFMAQKFKKNFTSIKDPEFIELFFFKIIFSFFVQKMDPLMLSLLCTK